MPRPGRSVTSKPASGTRVASIPRLEPTKRPVERSWPRPTSASPTASAGWTWPAVPPPVRSAKVRAEPFCKGVTRPSLSPRCTLAPCDPEQQSGRHQHKDQGGSAVGDERERDSGHRKGIDNSADVDHGLGKHPTCDADGEKTSE